MDANATGIYIANGHDYCLEIPTAMFTYCPEAFINTPEGVELLLRDSAPAPGPHRAALSASVVATSGAETPVKLLSVGGDRSWLMIRYIRPPSTTVITAQGSDLSALRLQFSFKRPRRYPQPPMMYHYEMKVEMPTPELQEGRHRYKMAYRPVGSNAAWIPHCKVGDGSAQVSFLVGTYVSGKIAEVEDSPAVTTMSCETGAIDSCIAWGYAPWGSKTHYPDANKYLFQTCLQAKRAAYFIGRFDWRSYTVNGTEIHIRDQFGIKEQAIDKLEAIWGPHGVECLNPEYRRRRDICIPENLLAQVPPCKDAQWSRYGKLATGPVSLTPTACPAAGLPIGPGTATPPPRSRMMRTP